MKLSKSELDALRKMVYAEQGRAIAIEIKPGVLGYLVSKELIVAVDTYTLEGYIDTWIFPVYEITAAGRAALEESDEHS